MTAIDEIKERLDIVEVISGVVPLEKSGRRLRGLCPFHDDRNTPSLVVFPTEQRWYCFGACSTGGDVFDFVMKLKGWDFSTALEELARRAGVELKPLTPELRQAIEEQREYEAALDQAADCLAQRLQEVPAALAHVHARGWPEATVQEERIGYANGWPLLGPRNARARQVLENLNCWAAKVGGAIVYVHRDAGRVVYLSGRSIEGKHHYNPPSDIAGPRCPYLNAAYSRRAEELVVIEGQACAITLGGWRIPALALAGSGVTGDLASRLRRHAESGCVVYLVPDGDGKTKVEDVVEAVGPLLRVVDLPKGAGDVNDYARSGATAGDFWAKHPRGWH
jgi:DNA primase